MYNIKNNRGEKKSGGPESLEEDIFCALANGIPQLAWMADNAGNILWYNQRWLDYTGTTPEEMHQSGWNRFHHPDYADAVKARLREAFTAGIVWEDTFPLQGKDGQYRWFLSRAFPIRDKSGNILHWFGTNTDIQDQRDREQELLASEQRSRETEEKLRHIQQKLEQMVNERTAQLTQQQSFLKAILENISDGIVACDQHGVLNMFNNTTRALHGLPAEPIPVDQWAEYYSLYKADGITPMKMEDIPLYRALNGESIKNSELVIAPRNAPAHTLLASGQALYDTEGNKLGAVISMHDITGQKGREEELRQHRDHLQELVELQTQDLRAAKEQAESANQSKTEFLANMSHEIRTPMNAVMGLANILAMSRPLTEKQKEFITTLQCSADSLLALINDFLDISKIETRTIELEHIPFSLSLLISEVMSMLEPQIKEKGLGLIVDDQCIKNRTFRGDPARLRQIIVNLCSNAVKFTDTGSITIETSSSPDHQTGKENICIAVTDSGIGIAVEKQSAIFEKFTQADLSINRKYGGTGLGLSITKALTEMMDGAIALESISGKGSTFKICIPLQEISVGPESTLPKAPKTCPESGEKQLHRILLVEDYPPNVLVAGTFLEQFGYAYDVATNGRDAVEKIARGSYSAVLMDVQMQEMNGYEATQLAREREKRRNLPEIYIIGMTAHALVGDRERCLAAGMNDYIAKPFRPEDLRKKLEYVTDSLQSDDSIAS